MRNFLCISALLASPALAFSAGQSNSWENGEPVYYFASFSFHPENAAPTRNGMAVGFRRFDKALNQIIDSQTYLYADGRPQATVRNVFDCEHGTWTVGYVNQKGEQVEDKGSLECVGNLGPGRWKELRLSLENPEQKFSGTDVIGPDNLVSSYTATSSSPEFGNNLVEGNYTRVSEKNYKRLIEKVK